MASPSLAEALGGYAGKGEDEEQVGDDAAVYVADLADALGLKEDKARAVYDVLCAIVESHLAGSGHGGKKGGVTLILG